MAYAENLRYSDLAFTAPQTIHWGLVKHLDMMRLCNYNSAEFAPSVLATLQALRMNPEELRDLSSFEAGHVRFNPASLWQIALGKEDPIRPGQQLARHHLAMAGPELTEKVLNKFSEVNPNFLVVTYPYYNGVQHYGYYSQQIMQTSPDPFDDRRGVEELIDFVRDTPKVVGILWDTHHAWGRDLSAKRPLVGEYGKQEFYNIELLIRTQVLKGVHVQIGRVLNESNLDSPYGTQELQEMASHSQIGSSRIGELLNHIKSLNPHIPLVLEIHLYNLIAAGLVERPHRMRVNWDNVASVHRDLVAYTREI